MEDGDYTLHVTFNDDVMGENIKFLTYCVMSLGMTWLVRDIRRAMDCMQRLQQPAPQAGWGLQHLSRPRNGRPAGAPAGARTYEPRSLATHTTQTNIQQLFNYFTLTGDRKYLSRVPEAIAWLKTCPLPPNAVELNPLLGGGRTHPTFIQLGTNDAIYVHRYGSNIHNGAYFFNKNIRDTLSHYSAGRVINIPALEARYNQLASMSDAEVDEMVERSPLSVRRPRRLPKYFSIPRGRFPGSVRGRSNDDAARAGDRSQHADQRPGHQGLLDGAGAGDPESVHRRWSDHAAHWAANTRASTWATSTTPRRIRRTIRRRSSPTCRSPGRFSSSRRNGFGAWAG